MKERQIKFLDYTVRNYIKTAQPVGSNLLAQKSKEKVSPATIRNDLMELEKEGFLYQPYTSAGRVPTEKGYKFWLNNFFQEKKISQKHENELKKKLSYTKNNFEQKIKELAKITANITHSSIVVGFSQNNVYYTGISHLFSQPEFRKYELVCSISEVVDSLDEVIDILYQKIDKEIKFLIGSENPFSKECSIIATKLNRNILVSLLGPMRMDYENNAAVLKYLQKII